VIGQLHQINLVNYNTVHLGAELVEYAVEAVAERACTGNDTDGDKGSNQAIFDGSCAGFVFKEACEESVHLIAYPVVVHGFVEPSST
jgi:hypothetical protein